MKASYSRAGITPFMASSGGGSDANIYNSNGFTALNLGNGTEKVHTTEECLCVEEMQQLYQVILDYLQPRHS